MKIYTKTAFNNFAMIYSHVKSNDEIIFKPTACPVCDSWEFNNKEELDSFLKAFEKYIISDEEATFLILSAEIDPNVEDLY